MRTTQIGRRRARELKVTAALPALLAAGRRKDVAAAAPMVSSKYARPTWLRRRGEKSNECFHASS